VLIRTDQDVAAKSVDMPGASNVRMRVMLGRADGAPTFAMRIFEIEPGGHTPLHEHNFEHEVVVLAGQGEALNGDQAHPIAAGHMLLVEPNERHQFRNTGQTLLKIMCLVPLSYETGDGRTEPTPGS